jgi:uncharacterized membrane protein
MDGIIILVALMVLAIPVSIIVLLVQVSGLKSRVARLEAERIETRRSESAILGNPALPESPPAAAPPAPTTAIEQPAAVDAPPSMAEIGPWSAIAAAAAAASAPTDAEQSRQDQNRPLVMRADRLATLAAWLRDNWVYVVSAMSLGLAGIFFVQYGMERGLLPPGLRVLAALAFGAGLIGAGEWLRRRHGDEGAGATEFLPSVFSGAGIVTLFAAVLAARQLYGLIGPGTAFAGHLATAALAMVIGWFSGPLLVAVGLVGASVAPFIVGGASQNIDWLYGYFTLIAALGLGVDALRRWAWVSVLALVLGYIGGAMIWAGGGSDGGWTLQLLALAFLAATLPELRLIPAQAGPATLPALAMKGNSGWPPFPVRLAAGAVLASTVGLFFLTGRSGDTAMLAFAGLTALALALLLWAERAEGLDDLALMPSLALLAALAAQGADHGALWREFSAMDLALRAPETSPSLAASLLLAMAALISAAFAYRALRPGPWSVPFALAAVLVAPLAALFLELWWQPALVLGPYPWALHVIGLGAGMVALALRFARADAPAMRRTAYATLSALSLIALALFVLTTQTALTLALAVLVVAAAALDRRFHLPEMSLFLQAGAAVLGYRLLADPGLAWAIYAPLGQVILAFGGAIAAMLACLWLLRPLARPMAKAVAESAAAGLAAILANVLISRWLDTGMGRLESHWGLTLNAMPWLILMLMQLYRARLGGALSRLRRALAGLGGVLAATGLFAAVVFVNPLSAWGPEDTSALVRGPLIFDTLLVAYGLPGLILLAAAWKLPGLGRRLTFGFVAIGAGLTALYAGLEIRRLWQGDWLGAPGVLQGELYSYTVAMMLVGAALFYQAIARRSDSLRRLAMAVIALVIAKVFLIDASGLTGLTRVVSFAGLGLSLAALAWLNRWAGSRR